MSNIFCLSIESILPCKFILLFLSNFIINGLNHFDIYFKLISLKCKFELNILAREVKNKIFTCITNFLIGYNDFSKMF